MGRKLIIIALLCILYNFSAFPNEVKKIDYSEYIMKEYKHDYFEKIEILYKEGIYNNSSFIIDYYLIGIQNDNKILLGYFTIEEIDGKCYGIVLNGLGDQIYKTTISGSLYNSEIKQGNYEVYGFALETLENPYYPILLWKHRSSNVVSTRNFMFCILDPSTNLIRQFDPTKD